MRALRLLVAAPPPVRGRPRVARDTALSMRLTARSLRESLWFHLGYVADELSAWLFPGIHRMPFAPDISLDLCFSGGPPPGRLLSAPPPISDVVRPGRDGGGR